MEHLVLYYFISVGVLIVGLSCMRHLVAGQLLIGDIVISVMLAVIPIFGIVAIAILTLMWYFDVNDIGEWVEDVSDHMDLDYKMNKIMNRKVL